MTTIFIFKFIIAFESTEDSCIFYMLAFDFSAHVQVDLHLVIPGGGHIMRLTMTFIIKSNNI